MPAELKILLLSGDRRRPNAASCKAYIIHVCGARIEDSAYFAGGIHALCICMEICTEYCWLSSQTHW